MGYGRGKDKKNKKKKRKEESSSSSESDSDMSYSSDSSYSSSDSEPESLKRKKLDSTITKKKKKKDKKKEEKKKEKRKQKEEKNKISKDDFYFKSTEFRLWLVEEKDMYFDQITSATAKKYFKKFVKRWNSQKLSKKYYKGIDIVDARSSLTKYKWKFADKMKADLGTPSPAKMDYAWKSTPAAMTPPQRTFSTFGKAGRTGTIGPSLPTETPIHLQKPAMLSFGQSTESLAPSTRPMQGPSRPPTSDIHVEQGPTSSKNPRKRRSNDGPDDGGSYIGDDIQNSLVARQRQRDSQKGKAAIKLAAYKANEQAKMSKLLELARANKSKDALW